MDQIPFQELILQYNRISYVDLIFLEKFPSLELLNLRGNQIKSVAKSMEDSAPFSSLLHLDLSNNQLHFLHSFVLTDFPSLRYLNLSHNDIHTIAEDCFLLPSLQVMDLSHNRLTEARQHFFDTSPSLRKVHLSHNVISRLTGLLSTNLLEYLLLLIAFIISF